MVIPEFIPDVHQTKKGTPYLKQAGVVLVSMPRFLPESAAKVVASFGELFDVDDYVADYHGVEDGSAVSKFAGQTCYLSYGDNRTRNDPDSIKRYFDNIKKSGHGSVLEHACYSLAVWGVDRAFSHEVVRHRAGWAFSQLSQRYVNGKTLRFVERSEYQSDSVLHSMFEDHIDRCREEYDDRANRIWTVYADRFAGLAGTDRRKAVNQAARNCLPNETETIMVLTGNVRAWRHVLEMRASASADVPISQVMMRAYDVLRAASPVLFGDYEVEHNELLDRDVLGTPWRKV